MRKYRLKYNAGATRQIKDIREWIILSSGYVSQANRYVDSLRKYCKTLEYFPHRGRAIDHLRPGYRSIGFRRNVNIIFKIEDDTVTIVSVFYGGQDYETTLTK